MSETAFYVVSSLILAASIGVVVFQNPVYSALSLVFAMLGVAGIFALLGAHFLAVAQIVVYAGAIVVLFLFVLMLLNMKREEPQLRMIILALCAVAAVVPFIFMVLPVFETGFAGAPAGEAGGSVAGIGARLFGACPASGSCGVSFLAAFEASSMLLIAALAGAVMLGKKKMQRPQEDLR